MKKLIPLALLLAGCAAEHVVVKDGGANIEREWDWTGTFIFLLIVLVLPALISYLFWRMPRNYTRHFVPNTDDNGIGVTLGTYIMYVNGPEMELPGKLGKFKGDYITALQFNAARNARIHKRMGRTL